MLEPKVGRPGYLYLFAVQIVKKIYGILVF